MNSFKDRLLVEISELSEKFNKLEAFILENGSVYQSLSNEDKGLLVIQKNAMLTYLSVLNVRINKLNLK